MVNISSIAHSLLTIDNSQYTTMIRNYFKIAWRTLMKNKVFSFINIFGLSIGLTCCMLIALYLHNEMMYDQDQPEADQIYQIGTVFEKKGAEISRTPNTPHPLAEGLHREFPEIADATHLLGMFADDKTLLQYQPANGQAIRSFYETRGYLTTPSFFRLFHYQFIEGSPESALTGTNRIILNEEIAKKIFGNEPAINKVIHINSNTNGEHDFTVGGVYRTSLKPSHIDARFFLSIAGGDMEQYIKQRPNDYATNNMFFSYIKLKSGTDYKKLEAKLPAFIEKYASKDLKAMGFWKKQFLIPLKEIHLAAGVTENVTPSGNRTFLYILASIAIFTLLIACINFMNLSTAKSSQRLKEVGIRKVLGANRLSLVRQFLSESVLMSVMAFLISCMILLILLPYFNQLAGRHIQFSLSENLLMATGFLVLALVTGIIAGSYPAFYLSSFLPVKSLKGKLTNTTTSINLRKTLVVFQFVISVVLIISSVIIVSQMNYLHTKDLGFVKDQQLVIPLRSTTAKNISASLKDALKKNPQVSSAGASMYYPGIMNPSDNMMYREGQTMNEGKRVRINYVDFDFLKTLGVQLVAGRLFDNAYPADTSYRMVVNESTVKEIGFASPQKAVGSHINFDWQGKNYKYEILGVVKDFHFEDLHKLITPLAFEVTATSASLNYLVVHTRTDNMGKLTKNMEQEWRKLNPSEPFEFSFLDEDFQRNYDAETRLTYMVQCLTLIAIFISCLGLFGLATFSAEQRRKEIGIRKVLGATASQLVILISRDFIKLVLIAIILASPLAWWFMNKWLADFAYRTSISWTVFVISAFFACLIAFLTICTQAIKAALSNPVKNLRTE